MEIAFREQIFLSTGQRKLYVTVLPSPQRKAKYIKKISFEVSDTSGRRGSSIIKYYIIF